MNPEVDRIGSSRKRLIGLFGQISKIGNYNCMLTTDYLVSANFKYKKCQIVRWSPNNPT